MIHEGGRTSLWDYDFHFIFNLFSNSDLKKTRVSAARAVLLSQRALEISESFLKTETTEAGIFDADGRWVDG
jgi:hypothetical protein